MEVHQRALHHGAHQGVTGSCHEFLLSRTASLLIDCGQFQGNDELFRGSQSSRNNDIDFPIQQLVGLVITHCHLDHVGRLPSLWAKGFREPIYCTPATASLLPIVLRDAMQITKVANADQVLTEIQQRLEPIPYDTWYDVHHHWRLRFRNAGHIMGSAYVELEQRHLEPGQQLPTRVVFSGDLGCKHTPLLPDPTPLEYADYLILESTYGDSVHENREDRQDRLKRAINKAFADGGTVLIPAFSIGRTQELLYEIEDIIHHEPSWQKVTVILDSPLASQYTAQYRRLKRLWDDEAKERLTDERHPLNFERLHVVESHQQHLDIVELLRTKHYPAIVIAASGMCTGGRIVNYLKALIEQDITDIIFVGYQAEGTPGRDILTYGPRGGYVELDGQRYTIKAYVHQLGGYSAHADQLGLIEFLATQIKPVHHVRLVHGELPAKMALQKAITASNIITGEVFI